MKFLLHGILLTLGMFAAAGEIKVVLFPLQETQIAARLDSIVMPYRFKTGEQFKKGDIICSLDASRYQLEMDKMSNHYDFAKTTREDKKNLFANKFTSNYELKKAEFDLKLAEISLAEAKLNLSFCSIKAPFDGKITEIITKEHELCRPGQPLLKIINDSKMLSCLRRFSKYTTSSLDIFFRIGAARQNKRGFYTWDIYAFIQAFNCNNCLIRIRIGKLLFNLLSFNCRFRRGKMRNFHTKFISKHF